MIWHVPGMFPWYLFLFFRNLGLAQDAEVGPLGSNCPIAQVQDFPGEVVL